MFTWRKIALALLPAITIFCPFNSYSPASCCYRLFIDLQLRVSSAWLQSSLRFSSLQSIRGSIPSAKMAAGLGFVKIVLLCTFATLTRTQSNRTVFSPSSSSGNSHESVLDRCFQKCASLLCVISVPALACQLIDKHMHLSCHVRVEFTETGRFANGHFANVSGQFSNV